jgi:branched-chain amino acid transport system substrate-binding protein
MGSSMTLVLFIPYETGSILISDRLNTLYGGEKASVDKIIKISNDTVIGFAGNTEYCQHIILQIESLKRIKKGDLSSIDICEKIKDTFFTLKHESDEYISTEFLLVQILNQQTRAWVITNGIYHEINPKANYSIGVSGSIRPHLDIKWEKFTFEDAVQFGIDLIGWASIIETTVGSPSECRCNICRIEGGRIEVFTIPGVAHLDRMMYRFNGEQNADYLPSLHNQTIRIGYISSSTTGLETALSLLKNIIEPDLNSFVSQLGHNIRFEMVIRDAKGSAVEHLKLVKELHEMGINFIIGGGWSSQASGSIQYCNENGILLFSHSSTSPLLAIPNDNFFRMCSTDLVQAPAIAEMLWSFGIKAIVVIQRRDAWADGIYNVLKPEFEKRGGVILDRVRYTAEATEWSSYLQTAENVLSAAVATYGADRIAIELISFQEGVNIITQAKDYPTVYGCKWFGSDGTSMTQRFIDDAPTHAQKLSIYSTLAAPAASEKYSTLYDRYFALVSQPLGLYSACLYDTAWAIAKAILEAQSTDARAIIPILPRICYDLWGASGWCQLNTDGDRYSCNYDIWGYGGDPVTNVHYGFYNGVNGQVTWDIANLGFTPKGP